MSDTELLSPSASRLQLEGALSIYNAAEQKQQLLQALHAGDELQLDLSRVEEIDTAGVQLLLLMRRESRRIGKGFSLQAPSAPVQELIRFYNVVESLVAGETTVANESGVVA